LSAARAKVLSAKRRREIAHASKSAPAVQAIGITPTEIAAEITDCGAERPT